MEPPVCPRCLRPLEPVLWGEDHAGQAVPLAWVCRCIEVTGVSAAGVERGSRVWERVAPEGIAQPAASRGRTTPP